MVRWGILETRRLRPVERPHDRRPWCRRGQLLLADVVIQTTTVLANTATQHQRDDTGTVDQVGVIPVVNAGTDNDRTLAFSLLGGRSPFTGELDDIGSINTGKFKDEAKPGSAGLSIKLRYRYL